MKNGASKEKAESQAKPALHNNILDYVATLGVNMQLKDLFFNHLTKGLMGRVLVYCSCCLENEVCATKAQSSTFNLLC